MEEILKSENLERVDEILEEIKTLLESNGDKKKLLLLSYEYYSQIPTVAPVPTYISNKSHLCDKYQTLYVSFFAL